MRGLKERRGKGLGEAGRANENELRQRQRRQMGHIEVPPQGGTEILFHNQESIFRYQLNECHLKHY